MTAPPDPGFQFWTNARRDVPLDEILRELGEERDARRRFYPKRVDQNRMTELEMQHEFNLIDELFEDFSIAAHPVPFGTPTPARPTPMFPWAVKINGLRREIMIRRNTYPKLIEQHRIASIEAYRKLSTIEAAHAWYWNKGLDFMDGKPGRGEGSIMANIRAEYRRREQWALDHGYAYDPQIHDAVFTGDWSNVPRIEQPELEAAE